MNTMKPIIIKSTIWRQVLLLLASLSFVVCGIHIILFSPDKHWAGWMSIFFFGACSAVFIWMLLNHNPQFIINDDGIFDCTLRIGPIPWSEIEGAYKKSVKGTDF